MHVLLYFCASFIHFLYETQNKHTWEISPPSSKTDLYIIWRWEPELNNVGEFRLGSYASTIKPTLNEVETEFHKLLQKQLTI